ncbi:aminotransferase class V-fold PLP-dependent enzyme [Flavitalea sp. BT771]|uniref:aminotransferase class V-fold PLP-dependent enzyme n=1 Tax=Flavitalea sp. BT771 TaxID=3063329 RepID=UPI0026E31233|nr:aminotransferase class V-fold PLP-dependent enzyme [Flavitalea sp. BT771]MDO6435137.1 aminotransferase class V-fold PLP-dependent enzyme [Flavitalea sp. BT771]MDV6224158.1 aminotransferase class V-fold PLP-dependent enzyme [Flavitalea sp. BT771]
MHRRDIIKRLSLLPLAATAVPSMAEASAEQPAPKVTRDLFAELGVTKVINANVTMTFLSGSLMLPEVLEAINSTSHDFANMFDLQDKVGAKIAEMLKVEAAMVTSGAACAILLGTAASITGTDKEKIRQIPNLPGPRPEVIMQKSHRYLFDQAVTTTGAKIVEVEGPDEMEKAFSVQTVMALFFNAAEKHSIPHETFLSIAKKHQIPTFLDAAADVPPVENLFKFQQMGFDLVTFSGGKMIRGPQSAGLLFGRKDLIEAAKLNHSPHEAPIGRPMKVNKEEMFGMYAALKSYLERDHKKEWNDWLDRAKHIAGILATVPTVKTEIVVDPGPANAFPSLMVDWDRQRVKTTPQEAFKALQEGTPSIVTGGHGQRLMIGVVLLRPDQIDIVAQRVKQVLQHAM